MSENQKQILVANSAPYPPIMAFQPNKEYAEMILPAIRQDNSEVTAIMTYIYQHWVLSENYSGLSDTISRIAKVEMHHLDMLGKLIRILGGNPKFQKDKCNFWNAMVVNYTQDIRDVLIDNIRAEEAAAAFYRKQASLIRDRYVCAVLNRIALDEMLHIQIFRSYLEKL